MAAHVIAVVHDGIVEIPLELKGDPRFGNGAKLQLVPMTPQLVEATSGVEGDWRRLRGILAHSDFDPNAELEAEKRRELENDDQWLTR